MLVIPKNASKRDHDFCNLYNSKILKAKKNDNVVKMTGANEKINACENTFERRKSNQTIKLNFNGLISLE